MPTPRFIKRIRHWRGHGVHSPMVYALVRNVFMKRRVVGGGNSGSVYETLRRHGAGKRTAAELHNLHDYCVKPRCEIVSASGRETIIPECSPREMEMRDTGMGMTRMRITVTSVMAETRDLQLEIANDASITAIIASPKTIKNLLRQTDCRGTSIDRGRYIIFFCGEDMPQQHFTL